MKRAGPCLVLLLLALPAAAETAYVTDELRLGVHALQDTSDRPFANLESGDAIEILEWRRPYARVRLEDGREGWVRAAFLVREEPAKRRVARLEAERDRLAQELAGFRDGSDSLAARLAALEQRARAAEEQAAQAAAELAALRADTEQDRERLAQLRYSLPAVWSAALALLALFLGMGLAAWWLDRRSRQRHGGFRIY